MSRLNIKDIDKDFFWELATSGLVSDYVLNIADDYLKLVTEKLKKDLDINFYVRDDKIVNEELGISISSTDCVDYDKVLNLIEKFLDESSKENEFGINTNKLANDWGYTFSHPDSSPYYEGNGRWHAYSEYSQPKAFEVMYFGVFGEWHKNLEFAQDLKKRYLVQDNWNEKYHFKGNISELDDIFVTFSKNGNISVKNPSKEFLERVSFFYDVCDSKFKNHTR